ncbi:MAG: hypothetical protein LBR92_03480 [Puniceicoccales bacterium]|jgi:hypothetical protein|nr:hypothetical protein [Puniceicoccales bacterium]
MDTVSHRNDVDNVARPRDGKINHQENLPYGIQQPSKTDDFKALERALQEAERDGTQIPGRIMEKFGNNAASKTITPGELNKAIEVAQKLTQHPDVLSEKDQVLLVNAIPNLANSRNSDYSVRAKAREALSGAAEHFSQLGEEAQEAFFNSVKSIVPNNSAEWNAKIVANIAHSTQNGLNDIAGAAQDPYINLLGNTAQAMHSFPPEEQAKFQQEAILLAQKTQFPIKFDADSFREAAFREALSAVPEDVRTPEYNAQLTASFVPPLDKAEEEPLSPLPEVAQTHEPEVIAIEILPQALPSAPETIRPTERDEHHAQDELEENFASAKAE